MHENEKNNAKGRVKQTYRLRERETLQEFWRKTTKKSLWSLAESERVKKTFELFDANELLNNVKTKNMLLLDKVKYLELDLSVARSTSSKLD